MGMARRDVARDRRQGPRGAVAQAEDLARRGALRSGIRQTLPPVPRLEALTSPRPMSSIAYVLLGIATVAVLVPFVLSLRNNAKGRDRD